MCKFVDLSHILDVIMLYNHTSHISLAYFQIQHSRRTTGTFHFLMVGFACPPPQVAANLCIIDTELVIFTILLYYFELLFNDGRKFACADSAAASFP